MNLRKFGILVGVLLTMSAGQTYSVGLGEIKLNSSLNESLDAQIQLTNIGDLSDLEMLVGLASASDFKQAGVDREFYLTQLDFEVDLSDARHPVINVSTKRPIEEPYLDFLIEMQWPSGRLLREYTLLLDLPMFVTGEVSAKKINAATAASPIKEQTYTPAVAGDSYTVNGGDTLWRVAQRSKPDGYGVNETMDAIYGLNPSAFINENKNLLKKGAVIRLPEGSQIENLAAATGRELDSPRSILEQTSAIAIRDDAPLMAEDFTSESEAVIESQTPTEAGRLKLAALAPSEGNVGSFGVNAENDVLVDSDVFQGGASAVEELTKAQQENEELQARLSNLEKQLETMERMVEVNASTAAAIQANDAETNAPGKAKSQQPKPNKSDASSLSWWLYLLIFVVALILVIFLFFRSKNKDDEDDYHFHSELPITAQPSEFDLAQETTNNDFQAPKEEASEEELLPQDVSASLELSDEENISPLEQAQIYIDLGNPDEAEVILKDALADNHNDAGLHLKLLEIYAKANDWPQFDMQRAQLIELDDPAADTRAAELRSVMDGEGQSFDTQELENIEENIAQKDDFDTSLDEAIDLDQLSSDIDLIDEDMDSLEAEVLGEPEEVELSEDSEAVVELDELSEGDVNAEEECATKLELAQAYIDMGDEEGAKEMLEEVSGEGSTEQQAQAKKLIETLG